MKSLSKLSVQFFLWVDHVGVASPSLESYFPWRNRKPIVRLCWLRCLTMVVLFCMPQRNWKAIVRLCLQRCPRMVLLFIIPQRSWKAIVRLCWQRSPSMVKLFGMPQWNWKAIVRLCWQRCLTMVKLFSLPKRNWKAIVRLCWQRSPSMVVLLTTPQMGWELMRRWCDMPLNSHQTHWLDWRFPFFLVGAAMWSSKSGISEMTQEKGLHCGVAQNLWSWIEISWRELALSCVAPLKSKIWVSWSQAKRMSSHWCCDDVPLHAVDSTHLAEKTKFSWRLCEGSSIRLEASLPLVFNLIRCLNQEAFTRGSGPQRKPWKLAHFPEEDSLEIQKGGVS